MPKLTIPLSINDGKPTEDEIDGWNTLASQHYGAAKKALARSDAPMAAREYAAYIEDRRKALTMEEDQALQSFDTLKRLAGINSSTDAPNSQVQKNQQ